MTVFKSVTSFCQCVDPCALSCGTGSECTVQNHVAICRCPRSTTGDPFRSCRKFTREEICAPCGQNTDCEVRGLWSHRQNIRLRGKGKCCPKLSGRQMLSKLSGRQMLSKWSGRQMLSSSLEVFATFLLPFFFFLRTQQGWGLWGPMWEPRSFKHLWSLYTKLIYSAIQSYPLLAVFFCYEKYLVWQCFTFRQGYPYWFIFVHV